MDIDDYGALRKKPLKLIDTSKTKKKHKKAKPSSSSSSSTPSAQTDSTPESRVIVTTATKAEQAFKIKQDSIAQARILKKASKTHKQRVEEFNKHLDSLSEHYDIPKVSWTK